MLTELLWVIRIATWTSDIAHDLLEGLAELHERLVDTLLMLGTTSPRAAIVGDIGWWSWYCSRLIHDSHFWCF